LALLLAQQKPADNSQTVVRQNRAGSKEKRPHIRRYVLGTEFIDRAPGAVPQNLEEKRTCSVAYQVYSAILNLKRRLFRR
jgi:hypothetical protein